MNMPDDPERLADAAPRSPLGELFASAARDLPSDEQIARLAAQLGPTLDAPSAPQAPASVPGASAVVKLAVVAGALAALVGAGLALRQSSHRAADAPTPAPKATLPLASALPTQPPSAVTPLPVLEPTASAGSTSPSAAPEPTSAKSPPVQNQALSEAALLEQARRALSTSPSYALSLANQHRTRFPKGVLTQEREVIAIEALRKLNRDSEANQRATGFSKAFPGSAHQRMVDEASPK
ncbi:MAG TPA: hypothetical protein VHM25_14250 [Polyangiaceae bacterium]|jgi:hypothetical protein|nr:hypothetical protein [Polyangiaceae bacterium]